MPLTKNDTPKRIAARAVLSYIDRTARTMPFEEFTTGRERDLTAGQNDRIRLSMQHLLAPLRRRVIRVLGLTDTSIAKRPAPVKIKLSWLISCVGGCGDEVYLAVNKITALKRARRRFVHSSPAHAGEGWLTARIKPKGRVVEKKTAPKIACKASQI